MTFGTPSSSVPKLIMMCCIFVGCAQHGNQKGIGSIQGLLIKPVRIEGAVTVFGHLDMKVFVSDAEKKLGLISYSDYPGGTNNCYIVVRMFKNKKVEFERRILPNSRDGLKCLQFVEDLEKGFKAGEIAAAPGVITFELESCVRVLQHAIRNPCIKRKG